MLRARKFLETHPLRRKLRTLRCGRPARMVAAKRSQRNWHGFIDNRTDCLFAMVFFTIMSRHGAEKIRKTLGWKPAGSFAQLVREMVEAELAAIDSHE